MLLFPDVVGNQISRMTGRAITGIFYLSNGGKAGLIQSNAIANIVFPDTCDITGIPSSTLFSLFCLFYLFINLLFLFFFLLV